MSGVVLHLSPHPDDELIGAPATLMALRDAGWRVVNLACGLGAPDQRARRETELREACRRAGFELLIEDSAEEAIEALAPAIVISARRSGAEMVDLEPLGLAGAPAMRPPARSCSPSWFQTTVAGRSAAPAGSIRRRRSRPPPSSTQDP